MIIRFLLLSISLTLFLSAYSPKAQFDKNNHTETVQQKQQASPQSVIGGAMGGESLNQEIQREEADDEVINQANCEEARRVCNLDSKKSSPEEP